MLLTLVDNTLVLVVLLVADNTLVLVDVLRLSLVGLLLVAMVVVLFVVLANNAVCHACAHSHHHAQPHHVCLPNHFGKLHSFQNFAFQIFIFISAGLVLRMGFLGPWF